MSNMMAVNAYAVAYISFAVASTVPTLQMSNIMAVFLYITRIASIPSVVCDDTCARGVGTEHCQLVVSPTWV